MWVVFECKRKKAGEGEQGQEQVQVRYVRAITRQGADSNMR